AHLAIAHPDVRFRVSANGRAVLTAPVAKDLRERVGALWGWEIAARLMAVERDDHGVAVRGFASPPDLTRGNRDDVLLVVNGRPVRDPALFQAVLHAYRPLLPRDRFPLTALALTLPLADVDVNVHPTKAWVRFRHPRLVQEVVIAAVGEALRRSAVVMPDARGSAGVAQAREPALSDIATAREPAPSMNLFAEAPAAYAAGSKFGRVLGQVQDTFVVAASDDEVFFVDQHAAHERVIVERLQADAAAGTPASQELLFPESLDLSPAARALLDRWREPLGRLGFAFEIAGVTVALRAVPAALRGQEPRRLVEAALDELGGPRAAEPALDRVLAFVACHAAIKANTVLGQDEMERLLADLSATAAPYFCPHGRPTMSRVAMTDIRREVKRVW
ncbi:MAG: hypothetical protein HY216_07515, partial [Candidatus Rokubacteria bacterium]|nr:hypothetical protein [Candidatus Rokubacteria bacterium]